MIETAVDYNCITIEPEWLPLHNIVQARVFFGTYTTYR